MFDYTVRRLLIAVPTLVIISLVIFLVLSLAPNDPMAQVPLTVPPELNSEHGLTKTFTTSLEIQPSASVTVKV